MKQYEIICTAEQTRKAIELGAPIKVNLSGFFGDCYDIGDGNFALIPTAEEMIGWLEEKGVMIEPYYNCTFKHYNYTKNYKGRNGWGCKLYDKYVDGFHSRKEATLAAIDDALEYLSNKSK